MDRELQDHKESMKGLDVAICFYVVTICIAVVTTLLFLVTWM